MAEKIKKVACPKCGATGDPKCYEPGGCGLVRTWKQAEGVKALEAAYQAQAERDKAEGDYWNSPDREKEEQVFP